MNNPCECCQGKIKFIRKIDGNFMHSMVIPEWFANYFGGKILGTIKLEAPNGNTYDVRVTENMSRTILDYGWTDFVDANQIKENYSLMFQYLGNARFEVTIFDSNGTEKSLCAGKETASHVKKPSRHDLFNSSSSRDGTTQSSAGKGSHSDGCPEESSCRYCKLEKAPTVSYTSEEFSGEDNPSLDDSVDSDDRHMLSDYVLSGRCDLTVAQELEMHALVEKIGSEIPVLVAVINKSNVIQPRRLDIRKDYALKYFPCENTYTILQLPGTNRSWKCRFYIRPSGVVGEGRRHLRLGKFVSDNNIREGDICLFQPMKNGKQRRFTITVHVLHKEKIDHSPGGRTSVGSDHGRAKSKMPGVKEEPLTDGEEYSSEHEDHGVSDDSEGSSEPPFMLAARTCLTPAQEKKVLEKIEKIDTDLPLYVTIINKNKTLNIGAKYVTRYLAEKFAAGHRRGKSKVISLVLQREGKSTSWPTELCHRMRDMCLEFKVINGWFYFVRGNCLREGDLCLFKLMKNEEPLKMMVYIIRREKC